MMKLYISNYSCHCGLFRFFCYTEKLVPQLQVLIAFEKLSINCSCV